jgi:hypothetical protein
MTLGNPQVTLEPAFWLHWFDQRGLQEHELEDEFQVHGPVSAAMRNALRRYVTDNRGLVLDSWLEMKIDRILEMHFIPLGRAFCRFPGDMDAFVGEIWPEVRRARREVTHLLWDVTRKKSGKHAAHAFATVSQYQDSDYPAFLGKAMRAARSKHHGGGRGRGFTDGRGRGRGRGHRSRGF